MSVRSGVLGHVHTVAGTLLIVIGPVPLTDTWIIKSVLLYNGNAAANSVQLTVQNAGGTETGVLYGATLANGGHDSWNGWVALGPGEELVFSTALPSGYVWISGAELQGHL